MSNRGDGETWEWQPAEEQGDRGPAVEEVTQPKRLLQQIDSEGELVHRHLDTRVKNHTEGAQVSPIFCLQVTHKRTQFPQSLSIFAQTGRLQN